MSLAGFPAARLLIEEVLVSLFPYKNEYLLLSSNSKIC